MSEQRKIYRNTRQTLFLNHVVVKKSESHCHIYHTKHRQRRELNKSYCSDMSKSLRIMRHWTYQSLKHEVSFCQHIVILILIHLCSLHFITCLVHYLIHFQLLFSCCSAYWSELNIWRISWLCLLNKPHCHISSVWSVKWQQHRQKCLSSQLNHYSKMSYQDPMKRSETHKAQCLWQKVLFLLSRSEIETLSFWWSFFKTTREWNQHCNKKWRQETSRSLLVMMMNETARTQQ